MPGSSWAVPRCPRCQVRGLAFSGQLSIPFPSQLLATQRGKHFHGFVCIHFGTNGFLPYLYHRINRDFPDQRPPQGLETITRAFSQLKSHRPFRRWVLAVPSTCPSLVTVSIFWKGTKLHTLRGRRLPDWRINQESSWWESEQTPRHCHAGLCIDTAGGDSPPDSPTRLLGSVPPPL